MTDVFKKAATQEATAIRETVEKAARSGAYLYPLRGIIFFLSHRSLWKPLLEKLAPTVTLGIGITTFMFLVTYLPQVAVLALFSGPAAPFSAAALVLSESQTLFNILSKGFLIGEALVDTFDGVLLAKNKTNIVSEGRQVKSGMGDPIAKLGKLLKSPFARLSPVAIATSLIYSGLNAIPLVGTAMYIILQGRRAGPAAHARYFQLKRWNSTQRNEFIEENRGPYTSFGIVANLLELVPIAGIFFTFTNTVGASLWAADLETASGTTAPALENSAESSKKSR